MECVDSGLVFLPILRIIYFIVGICTLLYVVVFLFNLGIPPVCISYHYTIVLLNTQCNHIPLCIQFDLLCSFRNFKQAEKAVVFETRHFTAIHAVPIES